MCSSTVPGPHASGGSARVCRHHCGAPSAAIAAQSIAHISTHHSGVAQWLACWAHNPKVRGSKPRSAISLDCRKTAPNARPACAIACDYAALCLTTARRNAFHIMRSPAGWWIETASGYSTHALQNVQMGALSRDSSVGRASDRRSEGPRFDPGSRHMHCLHCLRTDI